MDVANKDTTSDQYQVTNEAKLWNFIYGFSESLVLKCAVELEIADTIHRHGEPMTLSELASQLPHQPINPDRLYRLMRYLVHMKLFTKENNKDVRQGRDAIRYGIAPPAKFLVKDWEKSMAATILTTHDVSCMAPWHYLNDGLIRDCSAIGKAFGGKNRWDYLAENPEKNQLFNESMASDSRLVASALVHDCKSLFEGLTSLVDVGGGTGTMVKAIRKAFPRIKCTVYDLPHVIADASHTSNDPDIVWIEGDMFKYIPNAHAIFLKWILHDWEDDKCIQILKLCKEAVPRQGGKVIIVEAILDVNSTNPFTKTRLILDVHMMLCTGGKERTEEEWKKLIHAAGFTGYKIIQISAIQSVIEAYPY